MTRLSSGPTLWALTVLAVLAASGDLRGQARPLDLQRSKLTVYVYKSGLFSLFADDHVITAPVASGSISEQPPLSIELAVNAAALTVTDPDLSPDRRADVQARMLGPEVLDAAAFPQIRFASASIEPAGDNQWKVIGRLTIRGRSQPISFAAASRNGVYRGEVTISQRDFGIDPIRIAGGTVKVKNEVKIRFEIQAGERVP
jgi:hypothetical protein